MAPADCLYHSDQDGFGTIQKELVRCGWLPRKCAHRLAMAVCSCKKILAPLPSRTEQSEHCETVQDIITSEMYNIPSNIVALLNDCLNKSDVENFSCCQFITVLSKAKHEDFSMLSRAYISRNSKFTERDLQKEINRNKKLTKHQIEIIIKKKKKKFQATSVKLPIFPGNLQQVLKLEYVSKQKLCVLEPDYAQNNQNYDNNKSEAVVIAWGNPDNIKSLTTRMIEEARTVQMNMDKEREKRQRVKKERKLYRESLKYDNGNLDDWVDEDFKDTRTDDYSLKAHKSAGKKKTQMVKAQSSVLDGGHCMQCFKPFTNLHDRTECTFHAGYTTMDLLINKKKWSCCDEVVEDENTKDFQLHSSTGCTKSRVHSWRTHAKSKGKDKEQNNHQQH